MSLDRHTSTAPQTLTTPIVNQIGAWIVADTLKAHIGEEPLSPGKAKLLRQMALDLAEWLEGQAA